MGIPFCYWKFRWEAYSPKKIMKSDFMYHNYEGFPSIVLMLLSDADSCFTLIDCGQYAAKMIPVCTVLLTYLSFLKTKS